MKRFLYSASVTGTGGWQQFYVDAETQDEANRRAAEGDTDGIYAHEVEVTNLDDFVPDGETTVDDFGDFPPADPKDAEIARLSAALDETMAQLEAERARNAALKPVAWVRRHPDGALTNQFLEDATIEPVRKASGAWLPLAIIPKDAS